MLRNIKCHLSGKYCSLSKYFVVLSIVSFVHLFNECIILHIVMLKHSIRYIDRRRVDVRAQAVASMPT